MTVRPDEEVQNVAGSTMSPRQIRILKIVVVIMGVMLIVGFAVVIVTIVYQASRMGKKNVTAPAAVTLTEPSDIVLPVRSGETLRAFDLDAGHLAIHLESPGGNEIAIIDINSGKVIRRVKIRPE